MQTRHVEELTTEEYAANVLERGSGVFESKELRDAVAKILNAQGVATARSSISNQQLHPEYVTDYVGYLETGFGNTQYQTFWPKLYEIKVLRG